MAFGNVSRRGVSSPHPNPLPEGEGADLAPLPMGEAGRRPAGPRTGEGYFPEQQASAGSGEVDALTRGIGEQILARLQVRRSWPRVDRWWQEQLLDWCLRDDLFRTQMFRFVDVLPMLRTDAQVADHLKAYLAGPDSRLPTPARLALNLAATKPLATGLAPLVRLGAERMARRFIAGASLADTAPALRRLRQQGTAFTLDMLGEATVSEAEALAYQRRYLEILDTLPRLAADWPVVPLLDASPDGRVPRVNLSLKLSSLYSQMDPVDQDGSAGVLKERLRPIVREARRVEAFLYLDMEQYAYKDLILRVFREILDEEEFRDWPHAGVVIQAYLRDAEHDACALVQWARRRGTPVTVRLVRGAYWDYETVMARLQHWPEPVFTQKWETDANYEKLTQILLDGYPWVRTALGTHNVSSLAHGIALARAGGLPEGSLELQMLYGMGDELRDPLVAMGQRVRFYVPFGELLAGMAYLVRRLLENTSNASVLRAGRLGGR